MAKKTNCVVNGKAYYRINRKVGRKLNKKGLWVDDYKNFYGSCKSDAEDKYNAYMNRKENGLTTSMCLGELVTEWLNNVLLRSELANQTKYIYKNALNRCFIPSELAGRNIEDVTAIDLQRLYNRLSDDGIPFNIVSAMHKVLRKFYKYTESNGIHRNITASITPPQKNKPFKGDSLHEVDTWEDEELKHLIRLFDGSYMHFLLILAVNTGCRLSELLALDYSDIKDGKLYVTKQVISCDETGKPCQPTQGKLKTECSNRVIPLSEKVLKELKKHRALHLKEMRTNGYVTQHIFSTPNGDYRYSANVTNRYKRVIYENGIKFHKFHALRHTFGTNLSKAGVPIEEVAKLMGHSNINVTMKYYIAVNEERKQTAVNKIADFVL